MLTPTLAGNQLRNCGIQGFDWVLTHHAGTRGAGAIIGGIPQNVLVGESLETPLDVESVLCAETVQEHWSRRLQSFVAQNRVFRGVDLFVECSEINFWPFY